MFCNVYFVLLLNFKGILLWKNNELSSQNLKTKSNSFVFCFVFKILNCFGCSHLKKKKVCPFLDFKRK